MLLWIFCGACITVLAVLHRLCAKVLVNQKGLEMHSSTQPFVGILSLMLKAMKEGTVYDVTLDEHKRNGWKAYAHSVLGRGLTVQIVDPADIRFLQVTAHTKFVQSQDVVPLISEFMGTSLVMLQGAEWKEQRVVYNHIFTRRMLRDRMGEVFGTTAQTAVTLLKEKIAAGNGRVDAFDIQRFFSNLTFDTTNSIAFSRGTNALQGNEKDVECQKAFEGVMIRIFERFLTPWWKINEMFQLSESERDYRRCMDIVEDVFTTVIDDFLNKDGTLNEERIRDGTMSSIFVEHLQDIEDGTAVTKVSMRQRLRDLIVTVLTGARDTTSSSLTSIIFILCQKENAHWMEKLREEALEVFGGEPNRPLTFDDVDGCTPITDAVFMETVRLLPSLMISERVATEDVTFPTGFEVKEGQTVNWSLQAVNRNPNAWGEDADQFRPERWMEGKKYDDGSFTSFGFGPRTCPGQSMARVQIKMTIVTLFAHFRFELYKNHVPKAILLPFYGFEDGAFVNVLPATEK